MLTAFANSNVYYFVVFYATTLIVAGGLVYYLINRKKTRIIFNKKAKNEISMQVVLEFAFSGKPYTKKAKRHYRRFKKALAIEIPGKTIDKFFIIEFLQFYKKRNFKSFYKGVEHYKKLHNL